MKMDLKQRIDNELSEMVVSDELKKNIEQGSREVYKKTRMQSAIKTVAAAMAIICLATTTAVAGYTVYNRLFVNNEELPELDAMKVVDMKPLDEKPGEDGVWIEKDYITYKEVKEKLEVPLLDSKLAVHNPYMSSHVSTDNKDDTTIDVENYILGDTSNYVYHEEEKRYSYEEGTEYRSPISLTAAMILNEKRLADGWNVDYLGYYEFVESYTSEQGYKVNILEDTVEEAHDDYVSEKIAVFVADGIHYTLKGRTSLESIKTIVDSMEY